MRVYIKQLYHLRWCQENAYRDIKYPLCLRELHSKKYEYQANCSEVFKTYRDFLRIHDDETPWMWRD